MLKSEIYIRKAILYLYKPKSGMYINLSQFSLAQGENTLQFSKILHSKFHKYRNKRIYKDNM